jgi:WD40 repeat protein
MIMLTEKLFGHLRCPHCAALTRSADPFCPSCGAPLLLDTRYECKGVIGKGGSGTVYEAFDRRLGRRCAVKAVRGDQPHHHQGVEAEWRYLRDHAAELPCMPFVYDVVRTRVATYLVMEYIPGDTLDQVIARDGPWDTAQVEAFLRTLLDYLDRLHGRGLLHRDLKPQNIKYLPTSTSPDRRYVLLDFGIARRDDEQTQHYGHAASRPYSPPEQRQALPTDRRSDLFSLAATAFHLLTGDIPPDIVVFLTATPHNLPNDLARAGASPALGHALIQMLQLSPDDRPDDAQAALALLDASWPPLPCGAGAAVRYGAAPGGEETLSAIEAGVLGRGKVHGLCWSPGGQWLAVAAAAGLSVYDAQSFALLHTIPTDTPARRAQFVRGGDLLLVVEERTAKLWRVRDWSVERVFAGYGATASMIISPEGRLFAVANGKRVRVRQTYGGALLYSLDAPHAHTAESIAFAPDAQILATAAPDEIQLWRAADGSPLRTLRARLGEPRSLAFMPDGALAAAGGCGLHIWGADGTPLHTGAELPSGAQTLVCTPNARTLAAISPGRIGAWRLGNGTLQSTLWQPALNPAAIALDPRGRELAIAADDTICVRRLRDGAAMRSIEEHAGPVRSMAFSPGGEALAVMSDSVRIWSLDDRTLLHTLPGHASFANSVAFSPDGHILAVASPEQIALWQTSTWTLARTIPQGCGQANGIAFLAEGQLAVAVGAGIDLWQVEDARLLASHRVDRDDLYSVALAPSGRFFATATDRMAQLWCVDGMRLCGASIETENDINGVAIAAGARRFALITDAASLVYQAGEQMPSITLEGGAHGAVFAPDGSLLVTLADRAIQLWRLDDSIPPAAAGAQLLFSFSDHREAVSSVAFSRDGRLFASAAWDGIVHLWDIGGLCG